MAAQRSALWPHGTLAALGAAAGAFLVGLLLLLAIRSGTGWPDPAALNLAVLVLLLASLAPLVLCLLDFLAANRAVVGSTWFNLDLSRVAPSPAPAAIETVFVPANLGQPGELVSDSAPMEIMDALRRASGQPFAIIDIADGSAWWVTRLLAFSAGAQRRGAPEAIVFTGSRGGLPGRFLGWAPPAAVLERILADRPVYRARYDGAVRIARFLDLFGRMDVPGLALPGEVMRYATPPTDYRDLGAAALEQIVMDRLAQIGIDAEGSLEQPPDRLTLARLHALFDPVLVTESSDTGSPAAARVEALLKTPWPFLALTEDGAFRAMVRRSDAERALLAQLVAQSARGA
ncbi:hypothetical protein [Oceaniglobus roseus]|uniref:hypothetical protein n=1 Tax=Oceaniglobus roseus TaxID=1737570 RepID=UPI000C7F0CDF|nr:hypothetical protein [Kandeliimicrobium roseum]